MTERLPPQNIDTERLVLGAVLFNNDALDKVDFLAADDFYTLKHKTIFKAMTTLHNRGEAIDAPLLIQYMKLDKRDDTDYLIDLLGDTSTAANIVYHARIVNQMSTLRKTISMAAEITRKAYEVPADFDKFLQESYKKTTDILTSNAGKSTHLIGDIMSENLTMLENAKKQEKASFAEPTGLVDLDNIIGGLYKHHIVVFGGKPGSGKTALGLNIGWKLVKRGIPVKMFSLEMSKEQVALRLTNIDTQISNDKTKHPRDLLDDDLEAMTTSCIQSNKIPFHIDDRGGLHADDVVAGMRKFCAEKGGYCVFIIDYIQIMNGLRGEKYSNENTRITAIMSAIQEAVKGLDCTVIALSQFSRGDKRAPNKYPVMDDLRGSGSIEQAANIIVFLHNAENDPPGIKQLIIAKNRDGDAGKFVQVEYLGNTTTFFDCEKRNY